MSDQFVPPWMGTATLAKHLNISESTVENWVRQGILPPPRKRGGKLLWKWAEVDARLMAGNPEINSDAERITNATKRAFAAND